VAGLIYGIPVVMLKEEPSDFLLAVRQTAAYARYVEDTAAGSPEPQRDGDSMGLERLWFLKDTRSDI